jgi:hypothetical protein
MRPIDIERIIRRGASSLAESLQFYWPSSTPENEVLERNISVHLAHAFLTSGFFAYTEAHTKGRKDRFIDLLVVEPRAKLSLVGEFKRLYRHQEARKMVKDLDRLLAFEMQIGSRLRHPGLEIERHFGVLAAMTWIPEHAQWFTTTAPDADDPTGGALNQLARVLPRDQTIWNAYTLKNYHHAEANRIRSHWLVYAIFPLDEEHRTGMRERLAAAL